MKCPRDGAVLEVAKVHGVEVHVCPEDGGLFADHGELNKVAEPTEGDLEFSTIDMDSFQHEDDYPPIQCPRDPDVTMKKVEFNIYTNIILDWCDRCGGFWIDRKELDRINDEVRELNRAASEVPDPPMLWFAQFVWNLPFPH
ncbi:MAG: zf-TFIIB domain-containing protein [Thermoanaerobaculia bacterium]